MNIVTSILTTFESARDGEVEDALAIVARLMFRARHFLSGFSRLRKIIVSWSAPTWARHRAHRRSDLSNTITLETNALTSRLCINPHRRAIAAKSSST